MGGATGALDGLLAAAARVGAAAAKLEQQAKLAKQRLAAASALAAAPPQGSWQALQQLLGGFAEYTEGLHGNQRRQHEEAVHVAVVSLQRAVSKAAVDWNQGEAQCVQKREDRQRGRAWMVLTLRAWREVSGPGGGGGGGAAGPAGTLPRWATEEVVEARRVAAATAAMASAARVKAEAARAAVQNRRGDAEPRGRPLRRGLRAGLWL